MDENFYNSDAAREMAEQYKKHILEEADVMEIQTKSVTSIFLRRRRMRMELKLQRHLLETLLKLSPDDAELGLQIYDRLLNCVARMERLV